MAYQPPYTITPRILSLVADISEQIGRLSVIEQAAELRLRRINRIRTIQGSLAIEGNTLSEAQITAILDGKRVIAPPKEVQEARNALKAYEHFDRWKFSSEKHLLEAHMTLMQGLIDEVGCYRSGGVGVMSGKDVIHMAPGANRVPSLMTDLLGWLKKSDAPALVASSVFHYEFEFIHPFADGNGRMGRLWQTLILSHWNPLFANIPVESLVHQNQERYYKAIQLSTAKSDSATFIEFMLEMILDAIQTAGSMEEGTDQVIDQVTDQVKLLLQVLVGGEVGASEIMSKLGLSHRATFRDNYLNPAIKSGMIERTQPDSPRSPTQKYYLTERGKAMVM